MSTFALLLFCVHAFMIQHVYSQCGCGGNSLALGSGLAAGGPGLGYGSTCAGGPGYGASIGLGSGYGAGIGLGSAVAGSSYAGGYGGYGNGEVAVVGEMPVSGATLVAGTVPVLGAVQFNGNVPAAGSVTISGNCAYGGGYGGHGSGCNCACNGGVY